MGASVEVSEELVPIGEGTIYSKRWAPVTEPTLDRCTIVLFHDSLGCVDLWRQFPLALSQRLLRPVIAYDRLGFGRSSARPYLPSARFIAEEAETYFPLLKDRLGIGEFVAFGHSVGGAMAILIAAKFAAECRAVVTEAAQAYVEPKTLASIADGKVRFANPHELAKLARYHGEKAAWVVNAWTDTWLSPDFADWNLRSALPTVTCPLLAIHGDRDEYGSADFPAVLSSMTSGYAEQMLVPDCGHVPHREHEELVLAKIARFLSVANA
jgi:pimeloyl-ACP methyl ester carboxylesterase